MTDIPDRNLTHELAEQLRVPMLIARMLVSRGITTFETARKFFRPAWEDLYDPFLMADMDKAVERICLALNQKESIFIFIFGF